ncbi:MAG: hypothetical protein V2A72_02225 [Candidatus Omnitrophota bacterium]
MIKNNLAGRIAVIFSVAIFLAIASVAYVKAENKGPSLIISNNQIFYYFLLPPGWASLNMTEDVTEKNAGTGHWTGKHKDSQALMEISLVTRDKGVDFKTVINGTKEYSESEYSKEELAPGLWTRCSYFNLPIEHNYKCYAFKNPKKGAYELWVFIELTPKAVVIFTLTGAGNYKACIAPYTDDLNKLIRSFRLGPLSSKDVEKSMKEIYGEDEDGEV